MVSPTTPTSILPTINAYRWATVLERSSIAIRPPMLVPIDAVALARPKTRLFAYFTKEEGGTTAARVPTIRD
jgi:hypothetical protein